MPHDRSPGGPPWASCHTGRLMGRLGTIWGGVLRSFAMLGKRRGANGLVAVVAVAASLLTAGPVLAAEAVPPPGAGELRVITWNVCGEAGGSRGGTDPGYCLHRNEPAQKMKAVADLAKKHHADVVMLQEACGYTEQMSEETKARSHQRLLEGELPGWKVVHAVGDRGARGTSGVLPSECRGTFLGGNVGVLIAVKGNLSPQWPLHPSSG